MKNLHQSLLETLPKRTLLVSFCIVLSSAASLVSLQLPVHAASLADWQAGDILDDVVMTNKNSMNVIQIQSFLNTEVPTCDTFGSQPSEMNNTGVPDYNGDGVIERWEWGKYHYNQTSFTCLRDYQENGISSAQIIYNAAQTYGINPQVLLVLLQKEQGLITDTWPIYTQYQSATGYACPDSAPCSTQYYGLTNQLNWAAKMYQSIENADPNWYSPYVVGNNFINYNPNSSCGGSTVNIQNRATQALYDYTPYQPDTAALQAGYGSGDSCSSYGNRDFYLYFNDWFGSTRATSPYAWRIVSQGAYLDSAMTIPANTRDLSPNTTYYFQVQALNIGNSIWTNSGANPVNLATANPNSRDSVFCNNTWLNCHRPASLQQSSVSYGQTGTFTFSMTTPSSNGTYNEYFNLVAEGSSWFNDVGMYWSMTINPPTPEWSLNSQSLYYDSARTKPVNTTALSPGTKYYASIKALNIGNTTWTNTGNNPVDLGTSNPTDRSSSFYDPSWISSDRPARLQESSVAPGSVGTFNFVITAPQSYGTYNEYFRPVTEGSSWFNDIGMYWPLQVAPPTPEWSFVSQNAYTDNTMSAAYDTTNTTNNSRIYLSIKALNIGNTTWTNTGNNPVDLGTSNPTDRSSSFYDPSWISSDRPARLQESSVAPGSVGTFNFWVQAPYYLNGTTIAEYFLPVTEGMAWMNDVGMNQTFTFNTPNTSWQYISQGAYSDPTLTHPANLSSAARNTNYYLTLNLKNTSGITWTNSGNTPLNLGTSHPQNRVSGFYDTSWLNTTRPATLQQPSVNPGQVGTITFAVKTPSTSTASNEYFQPVIDGLTWLTDIGLYWSFNVP